MQVAGETERFTRPALVTAGVICVCVIVSHVFGRTTPALLLPAIKEDLVDSNTAAGVLNGTLFAGYILGVVAVTLLASRVEPIRMMRAGLAISVVALAFEALTPSFLGLNVGVWLVGFGGAGIWISAPTLATAAVPVARRGLVLGALTASMGVGLLIVSQGTTLYRVVVDDDSAWRPIFGIQAVLTVAILAAAIWIVRPARTAAVAQSSIFSATALRSIPGWASLTVSYTVFSLLAGAWMQFLGVALEEDAGFGRAHINNMFSVFAVAAIVGALGMGRLSDTIGRDRAIAASAAACVVASLLVTAGAEPWTTIAVALFGAGSFSVPPLTAAAVRDHLGDRAFGTAFGTMTVLYGIGSFGSALLAGVIADWRGSFDLVYALLGLMAAISAIAALARQQLVEL